MKLENRIQRPVKDTAEEMKEPLRIKMENFKKRRSKKLIDTHKITGKADGSISRMPSPADVDPLDYKTADILLAKDQHGNYQELDQEAVPPILLLDCILYKGAYGTRI